MFLKLLSLCELVLVSVPIFTSNADQSTTVRFSINTSGEDDKIGTSDSTTTENQTDYPPSTFTQNINLNMTLKNQSNSAGNTSHTNTIFTNVSTPTTNSYVNLFTDSTVESVVTSTTAPAITSTSDSTDRPTVTLLYEATSTTQTSPVSFEYSTTLSVPIHTTSNTIPTTTDGLTSSTQANKNTSNEDQKATTQPIEVNSFPNTNVNNIFTSSSLPIEAATVNTEDSTSTIFKPSESTGTYSNYETTTKNNNDPLTQEINTASEERFNTIHNLNTQIESNSFENEEDVTTDFPGITCKSPSDTIRPLVLVGGDNGVYWANMDAKRMLVPVKKQDLFAYSVDYHYKKKYLFFTAHLNFIIRMRINDTRPAGEVISIATNSTSNVQIAVDWVEDDIYWMSEELRRIEKTSLDGKHNSIVYQNSSSDFHFPSNLVIDTYDRLLFFVDTESAFRLDLGMNKSTEIRFPVTSTRTVRCLALDRHRKRLYWSGFDDNKQPYVSSSTYYGKDVKTHAVKGGPWNDIFGIDVYRDTLFFTHYEINGTDGLYFQSLTGNTSAVKIFVSPEQKYGLGGIRVYHSNVQSSVDAITCLDGDDQQA